MDALFNREDDEVGGSGTTLKTLGSEDREGYAVSYGSAMRMLVDLGDADGGRWVNQSGVSGHAFHRNYDDQTTLWVDNRMWPFVSSRAAVRSASSR